MIGQGLNKLDNIFNRPRPCSIEAGLKTIENEPFKQDVATI